MSGTNGPSGAFVAVPIEVRFWSKVDKRGPSECWPWLGGKTPLGYGQTTHRGRRAIAPRVSWELANGRPVPDGLCVCHKCDNPPCVNPAHLWIGTRGQNLKDAYDKGRKVSPIGITVDPWHKHLTHCKRGHEFTPENMKPDRRGYRVCRTCANDKNRRYWHRRRAALRARGGTIR